MSRRPSAAAGAGGYSPVRDSATATEHRPGPLVYDPSVVRSTSLQVLLYFSVWYDLLFALLHVLAGWVKVRRLRGQAALAVLSVNFALCFVTEPFRLYLGYAGNLGERVPELFLFVFLCFGTLGLLGAELALSQTLPDLQPANCSVAPALPCILPIELACWIVRFALLVLEFFFGCRALRRLIREKSARFFVSLESRGPEDDAAEAAAAEASWAQPGPRSPAPPRGFHGVGANNTFTPGRGVPARVLGRQQLFSPAGPANRAHRD